VNRDRVMLYHESIGFRTESLEKYLADNLEAFIEGRTTSNQVPVAIADSDDELKATIEHAASLRKAGDAK